MWIQVGANSASCGFWLAGLRTGVITFSRNITLLYGINHCVLSLNHGSQEIRASRSAGHVQPTLGSAVKEHEKVLTLLTLFDCTQYFGDKVYLTAITKVYPTWILYLGQV
jgi:hypothetical protein